MPASGNAAPLRGRPPAGMIALAAGTSTRAGGRGGGDTTSYGMSAAHAGWVTSSARPTAGNVACMTGGSSRAVTTTGPASAGGYSLTSMDTCRRAFPSR